MGLRAGIVGTGFIGAVHAHAVRAAGGAVARVAASTPERSERAAAALGGTASTAEEVVEADDVDVVHVCAPNSLHVPLARRALAAGKPVICEKPLAVALDDARAVAELARGHVATVPFAYRFYPVVREVRARVGAGRAGRLNLLHGVYLQDWQAGGAPAGWRGEAGEGGAYRTFADIGVHWCDLAEFVSGERIVRLHAVTPNPTTTTLQFTTDAGTAGSAVISQSVFGRSNALRLSVDGDAAGYRFDQETPDVLWDGHLRIPRGDPSFSDAALRYSRVPPGHPQGYQECFDAFVADTYAAVRGEHPDGLPTFDDGLRAAVLTDAAIRASETGGWVEVGS